MIKRSTVGCWAERVMACETGKAEFHAMPHWGCLVIAASPEILQLADTIICDDWWITTWQLAHHLSVSKGSVSHTILRSWIFEGVNEMGFSEPHIWTKNPEKKLFIWSYWHFLNLAYYNRWNLDPSFWTGVRHAIRGMAPSSFSQGKKNWKSLRHQVRSWSLSSGTVKVWFLWMRCFSGRQSTPIHTSGHWQNSGIVSNEFSVTRIQQKSCFMMTLPGRTHVCRLG